MFRSQACTLFQNTTSNQYGRNKNFMCTRFKNLKISAPMQGTAAQLPAMEATHARQKRCEPNMNNLDGLGLISEQPPAPVHYGLSSQVILVYNIVFAPYSSQVIHALNHISRPDESLPWTMENARYSPSSQSRRGAGRCCQKLLSVHCPQTSHSRNMK